MSYEAAARSISIAVVGDITVNRKLSVFREDAYISLVDVLRSADLSFGNLETTITHFDCVWAQKPGGISWQTGPPECLADLRWMGIAAVSVANNHAYDYSEAGFLETMKHVTEHGLAAAGGGMNLDEARAPTFIDLPAGRLGLMAVTSTFSDESAAGRARGGFPGKPGVNSLHHRTVHHVPKASWDSLRRTKDRLGYADYEQALKRFHPHRVPDRDELTELEFLGETFRIGSDFRVETNCDTQDLAGIQHWIRSARVEADWCLYSIHCHENGSDGEFHYASRESVPDFLVEFAHWAVDQGCDLVAVHGPHFLRGIEVYRGRPIFYSLGNFIFHNDTVQRHPEPAYARQGLAVTATPGDWATARSGDGRYGFAVDPVFFQSVVGVCRYEAGELTEVRLYPVELGFGTPISQSGRPMLAGREEADQILAWLERASVPFGTRIMNRDGLGIVRP